MNDMKTQTEHSDHSWDQEFDLIVLGSGVAGLTAALVGALEGMKTLLIEHRSRIGGTSARSSGTVWVPDNAYIRELGVQDDAVQAMRYLDSLVQDRAARELRETFVSTGPEMLEYLAGKTDILFSGFPFHPDYHQDIPGAAQGGRPLDPEPFDGRRLGKKFADVGWPLPELMLFGGMMVTRAEAYRLIKIVNLKWDAAWLGAKLVGRYLLDRIRYRRGTRLVLGNALVARFYKNLLDLNVPVWLDTETSRLIVDGPAVTGLLCKRDGRELKIRAKSGIVLAGGGFPASPELRERYLPKPTPEYTSAFEGCNGSTMLLAKEVGAAFGPPTYDNGLWFPGSIMKRDDGSLAVYPHIAIDRSKPGLLAVNSTGRRFVNEAVSYNEFVRAMYRSHRNVPSIPTILVCDRRFIWKYGLGLIRPLTPSLSKYVAKRYLYRAGTIEGLAREVGVDPAALAETVEKHNEYARTGVDSEFDKGQNAYDRGNGDSEHRPNPCIGPITKPPFYAVKVLPTPLGTSLGLLTDVNGQVIAESGEKMAGLFACGNDMHSAFGGEYPGAGAELSLGMVFGYRAVLAAKQRE